MTKHERSCCVPQPLDIRVSSFFRHSCFVIRHCAAVTASAFVVVLKLRLWPVAGMVTV